MNKILSIVVPSYNAEPYLLETIPTMLSVTNLDKLEIIIVNDGSTDNTLYIAEQLKNEYPETIIVIDKENGGHGSTINTGIQYATGKYFKVVDADDWVDTANLSSLIEYLVTCDDDEVISPFIKVYLDTAKEEIYTYSVSQSRKSYPYDVFLSEIQELPKMHAITIKTSILRENKIQIDENCFYVDLEYNTFPMPYIKTASYYDKIVYRYRLGSPTQSVSMDSYIRNVKMHERVIFALLKFLKQFDKASQIEKKLLTELIGDVITTHSNIYLAMNDTKLAKKEFLTFENKVRLDYPTLFNSPRGKKIRLLRGSRYHLFSLLGKIYRGKIEQS
ncbi:TPA: glycosyltransferase family 2 protein [Streptococcus suis]